MKHKAIFLDRNAVIDINYDYGMPINKVYSPPLQPTEVLGKFKKDDVPRKSNVGFILPSLWEFNLGLSRSILIGDKVSDHLAGIATSVGCNNLIVQKQPSELRCLGY